jgi:hypothetical protein
MEIEKITLQNIADDEAGGGNASLVNKLRPDPAG